MSPLFKLLLLGMAKFRPYDESQGDRLANPTGRRSLVVQACSECLSITQQTMLSQENFIIVRLVHWVELIDEPDLSMPACTETRIQKPPTMYLVLARTQTEKVRPGRLWREARRLNTGNF